MFGRPKKVSTHQIDSLPYGIDWKKSIANIFNSLYYTTAFSEVFYLLLSVNKDEFSLIQALTFLGANEISSDLDMLIVGTERHGQIAKFHLI